jgi:hypothetical protein
MTHRIISLKKNRICNFLWEAITKSWNPPFDQWSKCYFNLNVQIWTDSNHWIWKLRLKYPLNNWSKGQRYLIQKNAKYTHVFIIFSIFLICNIKYDQSLHNLWRNFNEFTKDLRHTDLFVIVVLNEWIEGIGSLNLW